MHSQSIAYPAKQTSPVQELSRLETQSGPRARRAEDDLPPTQRLEDKSAPELASELSETRMELEQTLVDVSISSSICLFMESIPA